MWRWGFFPSPLNRRNNVFCLPSLAVGWVLLSAHKFWSLASFGWQHVRTDPQDTAGGRTHVSPQPPKEETCQIRKAVRWKLVHETQTCRHVAPFSPLCLHQNIPFVSENLPTYSDSPHGHACLPTSVLLLIFLFLISAKSIILSLITTLPAFYVCSPCLSSFELPL